MKELIDERARDYGSQLVEKIKELTDIVNRAKSDGFDVTLDVTDKESVAHCKGSPVLDYKIQLYKIWRG